jgi:GT2 family glycosyltransferase
MRRGLSIQVTDYRTPGDLDNFCRSVWDYPPSVPFSVIICIPCATEEDKGVARQWNKTYVDNGIDSTILHWSVNVGYAQCNNHASLKDNREVLGIFNADVRVLSDSLDQCYNALIEHPDWGVVGPQQSDSFGRMTAAGIFGTHSAPHHRAWHQPWNIEFDDIREAVTVSGSAFFITRKVWDELTECSIYQRTTHGAEGAFLPTTHFFEETLCCYHAFAHGYKSYYLGTAKMIHEWHRSSPVGGWAEQQFAMSREFFRKACDDHGIDHD